MPNLFAVSFELSCPSDWDEARVRSWLEDTTLTTIAEKDSLSIEHKQHAEGDPD